MTFLRQHDDSSGWGVGDRVTGYSYTTSRGFHVRVPREHIRVNSETKIYTALKALAELIEEELGGPNEERDQPAQPESSGCSQEDWFI